MKKFHLNIPIVKIDEDQRIVTGIATSETLDSQGDIVDYEASKKAFSEWPGNIREMHGPVAIGKGIDVQFDDKKKEVMVSAKISESADGENAWIKVKEKILTGFSIGGKVFEVAKDKTVDGANRVLDYALSELSLVDNPANPDAELVMVKSVKGGLQRVETAKNLDVELPQAWWVNKFMGAPMQKSVGHTQEALYALSAVAYLLMVESDEPDQVADLKAAYQALADFAAKEVVEGDDYEDSYMSVMEMANKAIDLRKDKLMSTVKKTNVVGGEERDHEAKVTETQEESGRPVNDTTERATDAGVAEPGTVKDDKVQGPVYSSDDKTKPGTDIVETETPKVEPKEDQKPKTEEPTEPVVPKEDTVVTPPETPEDKTGATEDPPKPSETVLPDKSDNPTDLIKNVQALLTKLNDDKSEDNLKKVSDAFEKHSAKVEKSLTSLEERITTLEKQPLPTKGKASYHVVEKGASEDPELAEIKKRQDYLTEHPLEAKPGEAEEIHKALRKANVGERIEVK